MTTRTPAIRQTVGEARDVTRWRVIEHDNMTGWERDLDNMDTNPWSSTFTRAEAESTVAWREANIVNRYSYRIVEAGPAAADGSAS